MDEPMRQPIDFEWLFDHSPNPYMLLDRELRFVAANRAYLRVTGRRRDELIGVHIFDAFPGDPGEPDDSQVRELRESLLRVLRTGERDTLGLIRYSIPVRGKHGTVFEERYWSATHTPVPGPDGDVAHILQHTVDVTELQQLKAQLRAARSEVGGQPMEQLESGVLQRARQVQREHAVLESQRRHLLRLFDEAPGFMAYLSGPDHVFELVNRAYTALIGHRDVTGQPVREALPDVEGQGFFELLDEVYRSGKPFLGTGIQVELQRTQDARPETLYLDFIYQPVFDGQGQVTGIFVQGHDVTAQKRTRDELERYRNHLEELVLARTEALEKSEAALLQAQKMEAVGRLTGGVAHDFNNVLQVIGANLQLIRGMGADPALAQRAQAALDAVERGAKLASQLLAFARRQPLRPVVLDPGARLRRLEELLRRSLGETVRLRLEIDEAVSPVEADIHQLENAVLNLAINARDAMPRGGTLVLRVRDVEVAAEAAARDPDVPPGEYVRIDVADTGQGMHPEVRARAFEPFFTTKGEGRGTGLGLSMVYGFVKQSGGHVHIDSEYGRGTTVSIYLARSAGVPEAEAPRSGGAQRGRGEHVLVVEDDAAVRDSTVATLRGLGYAVSQAADAQAALAMLEGGLRPDLLFTDVIMPGPVHSTELAARARALVPGIAVLFASGYTEDALTHEGRLDPGVELLGKPYLHDALAARLRALLDARIPGPAAAPPAAGQAGDGVRVLFVEDDRDNRDATAALLRLQGHEVAACATAGEALAALERGDWQVLLADVQLPDMDCAGLVARVRRRRPGIGVVLVTGHDPAHVRGLGLSDPVLTKPFGPEQLQAAVRAAVERVRA
jgi:PAS domain S-box-containing protein